MFQENAVFQKQALQADQCKPTIYAQHEQAIAEYHQACRRFQEASEARERANMQLQKCTQVLSDHLQSALYDPTVPLPAAPNGGALGAGQYVGMPR